MEHVSHVDIITTRLKLAMQGAWSVLIIQKLSGSLEALLAVSKLTLSNNEMLQISTIALLTITKPI